MRVLGSEQTQQVTGGINRASQDSSAQSKGRLLVSAVQETALGASTDATSATDVTRSLLPATVVPDVVAEDSGGLIYRHRFIRFDANRLAPGDPDVDDFNGFNDQGLSV